jgi:hypothetical protein
MDTKRDIIGNLHIAYWPQEGFVNFVMNGISDRTKYDIINRAGEDAERQGCVEKALGVRCLSASAGAGNRVRAAKARFP